MNKGGLQEIIPNLDQHPFFTLMREYHLPIALATDNPNMGGVEFKTMLKQLAGLTSSENFSSTTPLTAEELVMCCLEAIDASFCSTTVKEYYLEQLAIWTNKYEVKVPHPLMR